MENNQVETKTTTTKEKVLLGLGATALATALFFGTRYGIRKAKEKLLNKLQDDKINQTTTDLDTKIPVQTRSNSVPRTSVRPTATGATFPLNLRAKGNKVLELQQSLMRTYGSGIFPKHGADGEFGSELASFLRGKGYGIPLSETDFKKITKTEVPKPLIAFDPAAVAKGLFLTIRSKNFNSALLLLKVIKTTARYAQVSEQLQHYFINGVRQTLVNAMLNTFTEVSQKATIKDVFQKMGLKYNAATDKWSLV